MSEFRVIAMASELVEQARATRLSPGYSHPVTAKVATGHGPCRHCLRPFVVGSDVRLLLTFDPFAGVGAIPQPGPIFVHEAACVRYEERAGYPAELLGFGAVLESYDAEQMVRRRELVEDGSQESRLRTMLSDPLTRYVMVRDRKAGCFDFRVEQARAEQETAERRER